jgi:sterol desaturase/sphingolipid hydroxylase (fatty acid hydroxylase superfamily)
MQLTRVGYFADFYVYPLVAAALGALALSPTPRHWPALGLAFAAGLAGWTLLEYVMHRWVFHHAPRIRALHDAHHADPKALIGTPTWLGVAVIFTFVMVPSVLAGGLANGASFTAGLVLGYLWYCIVHYGTHHWHVGSRGYFSRIKRWHAIHHHVAGRANFGVTTSLWDHVFRTAAAGYNSRAANGAMSRPECATPGAIASRQASGAPILSASRRATSM